MHNGILRLGASVVSLPPPPLHLLPLLATLSSRSLRSRVERLAAAARLTLVLTERGGAHVGGLTAWRQVELMAGAHLADASLTASLATAQHAPAYVRAHYLLALLHWLLADLAGKGPASNRLARTGPNGTNTPGGAGEATTKPLKKRKKRSAMPPADADAPSPPSPADQRGNAVPGFSSAVGDPRPWWLLAAALSSPTLPHQEVQAGALLKPLLAACRAAADLGTVDAGIHILPSCDDNRLSAGCPSPAPLFSPWQRIVSALSIRHCSMWHRKRPWSLHDQG